MYERYIVSIYERYYKLRKGDIVVDAGANHGTFSVKAAKIVGNGGKVIAIEPEVNNLSILQRNIRENELGNVVIVPKGLWSRKDKLKLNLYTTIYHAFYRHRYYEMEDTNRFEEVEVDTLDNILKELGVKRVDFIKMDIEGAEIEALKGMNETLENNDVKLANEDHFVNGKRTYKIIAPQLKERGFEVRKRNGIVYARKRRRTQ